MSNSSQKVLESIKKWRLNFKTEKLAILDEFLNQGDSLNIIIEKFLFQNFKELKPDFCPLFSKSKVCHNLKQSKLYCFACDCPHYNLDGSPFMRNEIQSIAKCAIHSKKAKYVVYKGNLDEAEYAILDCSDCIVPHTRHSAKREIEKSL